MKQSKMEYQNMRLANLEAVAAIEAHVDDGWSAEGILSALHAPASRCFVATAQGEAFAEADSACAFAAFTCVAGQANLDALSVAEPRRRTGVAKGLLLYAFTQLQSEGVRCVFLEARSCNAAALALYTGLGFVRCGLRKGFYSSPADDAVLMEKALSCGEESRRGTLP